jgi:hypothetical protein
MLRKIALAATLLAFLLIAPACAATITTYYMTPAILSDDTGLQIELRDVTVNDQPLGSWIFQYPPSEYRYYVLYYTLYNPTSSDIRFQFQINFIDENGTIYETEDNTLATGVGAGKRVSDEIKEYPIPKNAKGLHLRWRHLDTFINDYVWTDINLSTHQSVTATPTGAPSSAATATPTQAASPSATAKPSPTSGLLPLLAIGIVAGGFVLARLTRK